MNSWRRPAVTAAMAAVSLAGAAIAGPREDGEKAFAQGDYATALKLLKPLADQGDAAAQFRIGFMYDSGAGVPEDHAQGMLWIHKAADQGFAGAKAWLLLVCMGPTARPEDKCDQVVADVKASAERGDVTAQVQLGGLYLTGKGVAKDPVQGVAWIRKAADQGDPAAQVQLGLVYSNSLMGLPEDHAQSLSWYKKAADQGYVPAIDVLAMTYETGLGGAPKDEAQAAAWYQKGAEKGDLTSEGALAKMYEEGRGLAQDPAQAFAWYRKAAEQGDAGAAAKVGAAYATGKGVSQDYVQAYAWLDAAAAADSGSSADTVLARDAVAAHLTPAQLAEAKRQSAALKTKLAGQ